MENKLENRSIIVEIDEATKNLMDDIQSGVDGSMANIESRIKDCITNSVEESKDSIIKKLRSLDSLDLTMEELRNASMESQKLTEMVSPLSQNLTATEKHIMEEVKRLGDEISKIEGKVAAINENLSALLSLPSMLDNMQNKLCSIEERISINSKEQLNAINEQGQRNREFYEKIMLALNIIKNLVTPFWKRKSDIEL